MILLCMIIMLISLEMGYNFNCILSISRLLLFNICKHLYCLSSDSVDKYFYGNSCLSASSSILTFHLHYKTSILFNHLLFKNAVYMCQERAYHPQYLSFFYSLFNYRNSKLFENDRFKTCS